MFVEINGEKYAVKFSHDSKGEQAKTPSGKIVTVNRNSKCTITKIDIPTAAPGVTEEFVGHGIALCHSKDNFDKEKGRQTALARALEDSDFDKDTRTVFWKNYRIWKITRF